MSIKNKLESIKRRYYEWRYWEDLYRSLVKQAEELDDKKLYPLMPYVDKPGIAFSFDDSFRVLDWDKYGKKMFGYYDVKVTFNINGIHHFEGGREHTQKEIDLLLDLQSNGHEIAHHGFKHKNAFRYSREVGLRTWVEDEIKTLLEWTGKQSHSKTKEKFKNPVSFAFPNFQFNDDTIQELIPNYFKVVRGHLKENNLTNFNHTGLAPSMCIDSHLLTNIKNIKKIIKLVKQTGRNLILTCHSILPDDVNWEEFGWKMSPEAAKWRTSTKLIKAIIDEARKNELEFYTTSEIAGVATFIDQNFERSIRGIMSEPSAKWISISDLISIKELDLSNKMISNLDGIQYFVNLEKLNLSHNNLTDFRLLEKLPKLKEVDITSNKRNERDIYTNSIPTVV